MELRSRRSSGEADVEHVKPILQKFYYGNFQGKNDETGEVDIGIYEGKLQCGCCWKLFKTSKEIMLHCFGHVMHTVIPWDPERPQGSCIYCFQYFQTQILVNEHVLEAHTLLSEQFVCRICEEPFGNKGKLIAHMWKKHVELEMPYICEICNFCSSFHTEIIDHFQRDHNNSDRVICPFCLKALTVRTQNCITQIFVHLQSHRVLPHKRCQRCTLAFTKDEDYRRHKSEAHSSRPSYESMRYVLSDFEEAIQMPKYRTASYFCNPLV